MDADQIARLAFIGLIAASLAGWLFMQLRGQLSRSLQYLAVWALLFVGVIAAFGLWSDIRRDIAPSQAMLQDGRIELPQGRDGHYHMTLTVNGARIDFVVDTGASDIVLSQSDADRAGLDPDTLAYIGSAQTANGVVQTAPVRLDIVQLGDRTDRDLRAVVNGGAMDGSLLGMAYLRLFSRIEIADGTMILTW